MKEILITSSVLIAVLLLLRLIFAKKVSRVLIYSAWGLVALRLLIPVQIGQLDFSILTSAKPMTEAIAEVSNKQVAGVTEQDAYREIIKDYLEKDQTVFTPEVQEHIQSAVKDQMPGEEIAAMIDKVYAEQEIFVPEVQQQVQQQVAEVADPVTLGQIATTVWLAGVAVMAVWFAVVNLRHSRMLLKNREKLECDSPIPVYVSEKVGSPCLVGLFRPAIYLTPECVVSEDTRRHVLTHELTHYRHMDHIWSVVRCICLCVYWFNPLVWVAAWFSRRDCELACDEGALKRLGEDQRIAYGKSLLDVVSHASAPAHLMETATAMNETKKQLKERVNFIVKKRKISLIAAICMVLACALVAGCATAGPASGWKKMERQIQEDAVKAFCTENDACEPEDVFLELVSQVDDTYVMFVNMPGWAYLAVITKVEIGGLVFQYSSSQEMYAYRDGSFLNLKEAYESGWLSDGQLLTVWMDYVTYKRQYPQTNNPNLQRPTDSTPTASVPDPTQPEKTTKLITLLVRSVSDTDGTTYYREIVPHYDDQWNLTGYTYDFGATTNTERYLEVDAKGRRVVVYDERNTMVEEHFFREDGKIIAYKSYNGNRLYNHEQYTYDDAGRLLELVISHYDRDSDAENYDNRIFRYEYDENGNLLTYTYFSQRIYDGEVSSENLYWVYRYLYDDRGLLVRRDYYQSGTQLQHYITYTYDPENRTVTENEYDERDQLEKTKTTCYDAEGKAVTITEQESVGNYVTTTTYTYQTVEVPIDFFAPDFFEIPMAATKFWE